jgi:hypothetical protein
MSDGVDMAAFRRGVVGFGRLHELLGGLERGSRLVELCGRSAQQRCRQPNPLFRLLALGLLASGLRLSLSLFTRFLFTRFLFTRFLFTRFLFTRFLFTRFPLAAVAFAPGGEFVDGRRTLLGTINRFRHGRLRARRGVDGCEHLEAEGGFGKVAQCAIEPARHQVGTPRKLVDDVADFLTARRSVDRPSRQGRNRSVDQRIDLRAPTLARHGQRRAVVTRRLHRGNLAGRSDDAMHEFVVPGRGQNCPQCDCRAFQREDECGAGLVAVGLRLFGQPCSFGDVVGGRNGKQRSCTGSIARHSPRFAHRRRDTTRSVVGVSSNA